MTEAAAQLGDAPILDIGGDVGAIVAFLKSAGSRGELDARPAGRPQDGFHTGIHERLVGDHHVAVAVFPSVRAGRYELMDDAHAVLATVTVVGGEVSEVSL